MKISVIKDTIAMTKDETLIEKSETTYSVEFSFDPTWDGYAKTALFRAGDVIKSVPLVDDKCDIPATCLAKAGYFLNVLVTGAKDDSAQATPWCLTSRILYDTTIDIPPSPGPSPTPTPEGEVGRLSTEFAAELESQYTEEELKNKSLSEVIGDMDGLDNTATDEQVDGMLDDVWGPD